MSPLLREALACYGLEDAQAAFLQHNENLTYRVAEKYLLRIHSPAQGVHAPSTVQDRRIELAFLQHLRAQGIAVQAPIANLAGQLVSILTDGTAATLMTWLPGQDLSKAELTAALCRQIGSMTARLHQAAQGFSAHGIRVYDAAQCRAMEEKLTAMAQRHHLGEAQADIFRAACQAVAHSFTHSADPVIAIHDDLSRSNILQTASGLVPIDFSLMGMGHPMTDLGMLLAGFNFTAWRSAIVEGYAAHSVYRHREMEAGFIHGLLGAFVFHADAWPVEPWFADRLARWNSEMLIPFSQGDPIFDDQMNFIHLK